jgi:hypothetical protein
MAASGLTICKTVGSAYVGSNPTPATRFPRSLTMKRSGPANRLWAMRGPDHAGHGSGGTRACLTNSSSDLVLVPCGWRCTARCGPVTDIWGTGSRRWRRCGEPLAVTNGGGFCRREGVFDLVAQGVFLGAARRLVDEHGLNERVGTCSRQMQGQKRLPGRECRALRCPIAPSR